MRASTIFALTMALLIGLGAVVGARYAGWIGKQEPPPKKEKEIQVLVAARNLFPGDVIESNWVKTRVLRPEEIKHYETNKDKYLPAVNGAAALRVPTRPIEADTPILRDDLKELVKPDPLHARLLPNMRAVNISVPKDQSAGGLIQVGEWVDVYMTTTITNENHQEMTKTAPIAHRLRVIAKRNALWTVLRELPEGKPVQFTIEANPYRAALIEYAKAKGVITLVPLSGAEQRLLEEKRIKVLNDAAEGKMLPVAFGAAPGANNGDYDQEDGRVEGMNRGEYTVSSGDLVRIFDLKTPAPPKDEFTIQHFAGLKMTRHSRYSSEGTLISTEEVRGGRFTPTVAKAPPKPQFDFASPDCGPLGTKKCATCGTGAKKK